MRAMETITCKQCGSNMEKSTKAEHNLALQVLALFLVLFGICLLFVFPIGTLAGMFIIGGSLSIGYKKRKVWLCGGCGYFFERA